MTPKRQLIESDEPSGSKPSKRVNFVEEETPIKGLNDTVRTWLNSLATNELIALLDVLKFDSDQCTYDRDPVEVKLFGESDSVKLRDLRLLNDESSIESSQRDGEFWVSWLRCELISTSTAEKLNEHPRWQIYPNRPKGQSILASVSKDSSDRAKKLGANIKIPAHHLAWRLKTMLELPDNLGKGSSISHLCDRLGCIKLDHLHPSADSHIKNMNRQRCSGVTLICHTVYNSQTSYILSEEPCPHALESENLSERIKDSCRKVTLVHISYETMKNLRKSIKGLYTDERVSRASGSDFDSSQLAAPPYTSSVQSSEIELPLSSPTTTNYRDSLI